MTEYSRCHRERPLKGNISEVGEEKKADCPQPSWNRYPAFPDGFREFPGWPGLPEQPPRGDHIPAILTGMWTEPFDLVV
jgi:hypothetical protein